jgi:hypothetical protein
MDLPVVVAIDATGPHVCLVAGKGPNSVVANVDIPKAEIQKDIYYKGQRYWTTWIPKTKQPWTIQNKVACAAIGVILIGVLFAVVYSLRGHQGPNQLVSTS